jgi:hypothetical protein
MEKLENIPLNLDAEQIRRRLHMEKGEHWDQVQPLLETAVGFITARAVYRVCFIDSKSEDIVTIEGLPFKSRVLRKQVDGVERVFPHVITLGKELEEEAKACGDLLKAYYLDTIGNVALTAARKYLEDHLCSRYALGKISYMSPGSLKDWPIEQQKPLFSLLGYVETAIGVTLTDSLLMLPRKSISGIYFPTEVKFFSCQLCQRKECPSRKAAYSEQKAREYGLLK